MEEVELEIVILPIRVYASHLDRLTWIVLRFLIQTLRFCHRTLMVLIVTGMELAARARTSRKYCRAILCAYLASDF